MEDAIGQELRVGDEIAYIEGWGGGKRYLERGVVKKLTEKRILVDEYTYKKPQYVVRIGNPMRAEI